MKLNRKTKSFYKLVSLSLLFTIISFYTNFPIVLMLIFSYILFVIGDLHSTYCGMNRGVAESNPFANYIFQNFGILKGGFVLKNIAFLPLVIITLYSTNSPLLVKYLVNSFFICLGLSLTIHNYKLAFKL